MVFHYCCGRFETYWLKSARIYLLFTYCLHKMQCFIYYSYYLRRRLASGKVLCRSASVCHAATLCACVLRISLEGEGNALYPVLSRYVVIFAVNG